MSAWPFIDLGTMTEATATGISQLLTVVLFAYLVELGAQIRGAMSTDVIDDLEQAIVDAPGGYERRGPIAIAQLRRIRGRLLRAQVVLLVTTLVLFVVAQLPLLGAMDGGPLKGAAALITWLTSVMSFLIIIGSLCGAFFLPRKTGRLVMTLSLR